MIRFQLVTNNSKIWTLEEMNIWRDIIKIMMSKKVTINWMMTSQIIKQALY